MANVKIGLLYYSVDTDRYQDKKIKKLRKVLGPSGVGIYDYILCEIYREEGCFILWDDSTVFDVADYWGVKESLVIETVSYCCSVGLFHKGLLDSEGVLTSKSIQARYISACKRAKRLGANIPENIFISTEKRTKLPEESAKLPEECTDYSISLPRSKVKESKVKYIEPLPFSWPGTPKSSDIPKIPEDRAKAICERQYQKGYRNVSVSDVIAYWSVWVIMEITGEKFYASVNDVYKHFFNRCEQIKIEQEKKIEKDEPERKKIDIDKYSVPIKQH